MKTWIIISIVLVLAVLSYPVQAAEEKPEVTVEVFEWYCIENTCDLGIDFLLNGRLVYQEGVVWRYRLEGESWSVWSPMVVDHVRIFIPWIPNEEISGKVQFRYNLPHAKGQIRESFSRVTDSY